VSIPGGKKVEIRLNQELGRIERIYDVYPYPREEVLIVMTDMVALSLAAAKPEEKDPNYLTDSQVPLLWHFTSCNIANQGRWLEKIVDEICADIKPVKIRIVWMPLHKTGEPINYVKDIMDIADILLKLKVVGRKTGVSVRTALAKVWLPKHIKNQPKALKIQRLNLAMEVLAFYWFRCRCLDMTKLVMIKTKKDTELTDEIKMEIPGFDGFVFNPRAYRNLVSDPMEVSFFTGRRAREIIRRTLKIHGVEPKWEDALVAKVDLEKVIIPQVLEKGKPHILSAPLAGGEASHKAMIARVQVQADYELGLSDNNILPDTGLYKYFWEGLNMQTMREGAEIDPYKRDPVARGNLIPFTVLPTTKGVPVRAYPDNVPIVIPTGGVKLQDNTKNRQIDEVVEVITKYYATVPNSAPDLKNKTPIQDRLGPKLETEKIELISEDEPHSETQEMETEGDVTVIEMIEEFISNSEEKREESGTRGEILHEVELVPQILNEGKINEVSPKPRSKTPTKTRRSPSTSPIRPRTSTPKSSRKTREVSPEPEKPKGKKKTAKPVIASSSSSEEEEDSDSPSSESSSEEETEEERIKRWSAMITLMEKMDQETKEKKKEKKKEKERQKKLKLKKKQKKADKQSS